MSRTYIPTALRQLVYDRAQGCCEYCLVSDRLTLAPHEIDHIIAEKHGGSTSAENLALACVLCNKRKGSDIASIDPETGEVSALFHPRKDVWHQHFQQSGARFLPLTLKGRTTLQLLQLNQQSRLEERLLLIDAGLLSQDKI